MKALNERWNMELFKLGERLKSCRVKLPLKENLASWKNLIKFNIGKRRALHLGLSISTHLCSLVAEEPWGYLGRLEYTSEILAGSGPEQPHSTPEWNQAWSCFESGAGWNISKSPSWKKILKTPKIKNSILQFLSVFFQFRKSYSGFRNLYTNNGVAHFPS